MVGGGVSTLQENIVDGTAGPPDLTLAASIGLAAVCGSVTAANPTLSHWVGEGCGSSKNGDGKSSLHGD